MYIFSHTLYLIAINLASCNDIKTSFVHSIPSTGCRGIPPRAPLTKAGALVTIGEAKEGYDMTKLMNCLRDEKGATAIEYGLIASLIAVAIITAVTSLGTGVGTTFDTVATELQ